MKWDNDLIIEHVPGMFAPDKLRAARDYLDERFRNNVEGSESEREVQAVSRGEGSDSIRLDARWYDIWLEPTAQLLEAIGSRTWVIFPPQVRWMRSRDQQVPWHQDLGFQRLLGNRCHAKLITCFVPLEEQPSRHATVEFAEVDAREMEHIPLQGFGAGLPGEQPGRTWHYDLALGDALIFSELAVHRTVVPERATPERRSLEFRIIEPAIAIEGKDYFDIDRGLFVRMSNGHIVTCADPLNIDRELS